MKGVILSLAPHARLVDVTHEIRAQRVEEAAFLLGHIAPTFPAGTIHVVVVDPGVGTERQPVGIACEDGSLLIGPDNGVLAPARKTLGTRQVVRLVPSKVAPGRAVSATFHGRDLFAPAAARLATGAALLDLGEPTLLRGEAGRRPQSRDPGSGFVVHVDVFGNLITDVSPQVLPGPGRCVRLSYRGPRGYRTRILPRVRTYGDLPPGGLGVLVSSFGTVEVARAEGSAADTLSLEEGSGVTLLPVPPRHRAASRHRQSL
jgi:S-adenosylmethionine hydrolase